MADDIDLVSDINNGDLDAGGPVQAPAGTVPAAGADAVPASAAPAKAVTTEPSIRDSLTAAFRGKDGEPTEQAAAAPVAAQTRNADGTFGPKAAATPEQGALDAAEAAQAVQPISAPAYMAPEQAQQFAALPVEMQQFVARTMAVVEEAAARYTGYEQIEQVIGNRRQAWAINGMSEGQALNQLFALSDFASTNPTEFVKWFAGSQNIDLVQLTDEGGEQDIDPIVQGLRQEVQRLSGTLNHMTQGQQQQSHNNVVGEITQFAKETGTDGQPLRPYFNELGSTVLPYIQHVKAENPNWSHNQVLSEAYDRACWGTPSVRAKLVAAQEAERLAAQRTNAARSKLASTSVNGDAPNSGSQMPKDLGTGSVRDTLRAQFEQYH